MKSVIFCLILVGFCSCTTSYLKLGAIFQDNMVLQMAPYRAQLWGYAKPNSYVYALLEAHDYRTRSDKSGFWVLQLNPHKQNDRAYSIHVSSGDEVIILKNVLFGDVWICAGQSNMEMNIEASYNSTKTFEDGDDFQTYRLMRIMSINRKYSDEEQADFQPEDISLPWQYPTSKALGKGQTSGFSYFSATCFHFGNSLYHRTYVPMGLISISYTSSTIESWVSQDIYPLCKNPHMSKFPFDKPSRLYNGMMNPLFHMSIKGMVWYQGEDNRANPGDYKTDDGYACFFSKLIEDYRSKFSKNSDTDPKFPFGFVQLSGYCGSTNHTCDGSDENLGFIRMAQTAGYGYAPNPAMENTFMATAIDLPDPIDTEPPFGDLHPRTKLDVGIRLANGALKYGYNVNWVAYIGPLFDSCLVNGNELIIGFNKELLGNDVVNVKNERGIDVYSNGNWLSVPIINHSQTNVTISLQNAPNPTMVRYAWGNNPCCPLAYQYEKPVRCPNYQCSLYTQSGNLPTPPFISNIVNGKCSN